MYYMCIYFYVFLPPNCKLRKIFLSNYAYNQVHYCSACCFMYTFVYARKNIRSNHTSVLVPCSIYARKIFPLYLYVYYQVHYCSACCFMYTFGNNICSDYTYWLPAPFMQRNYFSLIIRIFLPPTLLHRAGYDTRVYVEGLHVTGSVQAVVTLDYEAPFPHVASITATFVRK